MIGLDTTAIIDLFKEDKKLKEVIESLEETFTSTIINYQELFFGLNPDNEQHKKEGEYYDQFFDNVTLFEHNINSAKKSSEIFWKLSKDGATTGRFDSMIAGILIANGVNKIITRNVKHFENIKELEVIGY